MKQTAKQDAYPEHSVVHEQGSCINARLPAIGSCRPRTVPGLHTRSAFIRTLSSTAPALYMTCDASIIVSKYNQRRRHRSRTTLSVPQLKNFLAFFLRREHGHEVVISEKLVTQH